MALPIVLVPHPHVRVDPKVLGGSPHVIGSRVPVRRLWAFYRSGTPIEKLIRRFPQLGAAKIFDALAFAFDNEEVIEADLARERALLEHNERPVRAKVGTSEQMDLPFAGPAKTSAPLQRAKTATRKP